jgi:hypothetical protein
MPDQANDLRELVRHCTAGETGDGRGARPRVAIVTDERHAAPPLQFARRLGRWMAWCKSLLLP